MPFTGRHPDWNAIHPDFLGVSGPVNRMNPSEHDALDVLRLVWGEVCELISVETNRYAQQRGVSNWQQTNADEIWAFLGALLRWCGFLTKWVWLSATVGD